MRDNNKLYYTWDNLSSDLGDLVNQMAKESYKPDVILAPGRGGFPPGVMLSHYFEVPFHGFEWQTRDGAVEDSRHLEQLLSKYIGQNIIIIDDINDSGKTLTGIHSVALGLEKDSEKAIFFLHEGLKYVTLYDKLSSKFGEVKFTANEVAQDEEQWIVFPYEEWWK